jgi:hypothetical protein
LAKKTAKAELLGRLALACGGCGEIVLLLGRKRGWCEPGASGDPRGFPCGGCGVRPILANRVVGADARRSLRRPSGGGPSHKTRIPSYISILGNSARARLASERLGAPEG